MAIETIEHARDIRTLLDYTARRLKPGVGARLFVQSLLHQSRAYLMDDSNWMGRNFFRDKLVLFTQLGDFVAIDTGYGNILIPGLRAIVLKARGDQNAESRNL